jgi:membrane-bound lytic murein transglycosylase D
LRPYLPKETNGYVPAFIAVNYIMNHHRDHNIKPIQAKYHRYEIDSIYVRQEMTFKQISEVLGIEIAELQVLNPMYITGFIPAKWKPLPVYLPKSYIGDFIVNEPLLYRYVTGGWAEPPIDSNKVQQGYFAQYHKVGRTESLEFLSLKYKVEVDTLVAWNQLGEKNRLFLGQNLVIYTKDAALVEPKPKPEPKIETPTQAPAQYHTVRSGETLWAVARKYNTTPDAIKAKNGLKSDGLQVGQRLKIK